MRPSIFFSDLTIFKSFFLASFVAITLGQHTNLGLCTVSPNGINEACVMGNFFPINSVKLYHSHGSFYNFCLNQRQETVFNHDPLQFYCYDIFSYEDCSNSTSFSGDSNFCMTGSCVIDSPCYCMSGFMSTEIKCVINNLAEPLLLVSDSPGGIILNSNNLISSFNLNSGFELPNFISAQDGFIISYSYPFNVLLSTTYGKHFVSSGSNTQLYYKFPSDYLKTNFRYSGLILDVNNQTLMDFASNHTSQSTCEQYKSDPCYLCKSSFKEFHCKDLEDKIVTSILLSLILIILIIFFIISFVVIKKLFTCLDKFIKPKVNYISETQISRNIKTKTVNIKNWFVRLFSRPVRVPNGVLTPTNYLLLALVGVAYASPLAPVSTVFSSGFLALILIKRKQTINLSLGVCICLFFIFSLALCCDSGASFSGQISNCNQNGVCTITASTSGVSSFVGQETCLNFLDNNNNGVAQLKMEIVSVFFKLAYSLVYYSGDRQVVGYGSSHCYGIGHCPGNCNSSIPDRTFGGTFTDPLIPITKGELRCDRYDIQGFCPFPGDDCQYCGYYIQPIGQPYRVYQYNSPSSPNMLVKLNFIQSSYTEEVYETFVKGINKIVCFGTVCFNILLDTNSDFLFDPNIQYTTYPNYITGSSDTFSLPGLPVVNKIGDVQSNSPNPWSALDYSNIIYTPSIVNQYPSVSGCTFSSSTSRFNNNLNSNLPFFRNGVYYEASDTDNFNGITAHKSNTTSTLYTITTTSNSTIIRVVTSNMFTIQNDVDFSGCCDCITGALMCFDVVMSDPDGTGEVNSDDIIFTDPIFRNGRNCLSFLTEDCQMNNHDFTFTSNSMTLSYEFDVSLNEVNIDRFSSIRYTTIQNFDTSVDINRDNDQNIGNFLENIFGFKNNTISTAIGVLFYSILGICLILCLLFCFVNCVLRLCLKPIFSAIFKAKPY